MAGIFKAFQKILMGKPVFEDESDKAKTPVEATNFAAQVQKTEIPLVRIESIECQELGTIDMSLNVHIKNHSNQNIVLQKIEMLGNKRGLGYTLRPGEDREIVEVYRGKQLHDTSNRHFDLDYKGVNGEFFRTVHSAQYKQETSNSYIVVAARMDGPIRKI